jgi:two-component system response regulator YesN
MKDLHILENMIDQIIQKLENSCKNVNIIKEASAATALEIVVSAKNFLPKGIDLWEEETSISKIFNIQNIGEIKNLLLNLCKNIFVKFVDSYKNISPIVSRTIKYIDKKYKQGISLKSIALELNANPVYLGKIFKEYTGEFFTDCLNRYRIEQAKILIRDKMSKISDISSEVGYADSNYFYRIFKKYTGISVAEYKKLSSAK